MRRRLLLSTVAAAGLFAAAWPAGAADLAVAPAPVIAPVPAFSWTGWYVGGNLGGVSGRLKGLAHASPVEPFTSFAGDFLNITDTDGFVIGGGQLGFNWQTGPWVLGLEGDLDATGVERTIRGPGSSIFVLGHTLRFENDWQASVRARGGVAFDRWLAYATGGVAWAGVSAQGAYAPNTYTDNTSTNLGAFSTPGQPNITVEAPASFGSDRHTLVGGTIGAGVEYALTDNVSLGVEYRYTHLGAKTFNLGGIPLVLGTSNVTARLEERTSQVTARLNVKYGGLLGLGSPVGIDGLANWWTGLFAAAPQTVAAAPAVAPIPFTWSGWYVGGHVGGQTGKYAFDTVGGVSTDAGTEPFRFTGKDSASVLSGGQLGFNWQIGPWVLGAEGDVDMTEVTREFTLTDTPSIAIAPGSIKNDWQASLRARGGIAFERWLVYATGGVGFASVSAEGIYAPGFTVASMPAPAPPEAPSGPTGPNMGMTMPTAPTPPSAPSTPSGAATHLDFGSQRRTLVGGTVGGGIEYALSNNISLGVEYRYSDFGHATFTNLGGSAINTTTRVDLQTHQVTGRLNVKLGGLFWPDANGSLLANWWSGLDPGAPPHLAPRVEPVSPVYGGAEYLLWWVKAAPLSVPLVSTGPRATTHHGFIHSYDTTILYGAHLEPSVGGDDSQSFSPFSGTRLTLGYWLDDARKYAVEGRGFVLQTRTAGYENHAETSGDKIINIPVYNVTPYSPFGNRVCPCLGPGEDGYPPALADPSTEVGGVKVTNSLRFWGADATGVMNLYRAPSWDVSALGGFRYLDLSERLNLMTNTVGLANTEFSGQSGTQFDNFQTRNQFYGATLGLRGSYAYGPLSLETSGRVSLGVMHQALTIYGGYQTYNFNGLADSHIDGIFAMPANTGHYTANEFAIVPEAQVKLGYDITPAIRFSVGYDFLYESSVVRPGDQINRNIPKGQTFHQATNVDDPTHPSPLFNRTDFFAHGLTIGLSYRY